MADSWTTAQTRILDQFKDRPKMLAMLEAIFDRVDNIEDVLIYLRDYRGLETAEGVWLDIIGDIVGIERPPLEQGYATIFAFKDTEDDLDDPHKGLTSSGGG